ncbi:hypothetical protein BH20ACT2_BH20ACT2_06720 [soil metagenome]
MDSTAGRRDGVIDLVRSGATTTVVVYHWVFTIIVWRADGPHADNPIGYVSGLWCLTWVLQVMPLFFMAGGYTHSLAWQRHGGRGWATFVGRRAAQLAVPAAALIGVVVAAGYVIAQLHQGPDDWLPRGVTLVLSPLWFLAVFLLLVALVPVAARLHDRFGELAVLGLAAAAMGVDVARFRYGVDQLALANLVFVWGFCHQVGFSWERLRDAPTRFGHLLVLIGFTGLVGLTNMGLYPRSMVGTTSAADRFSNMGPPTLPIVALCCLQVGLLVTYRQRLETWSLTPRVRRAVRWLSANAMPLFLWHSVGFAVFYAALHLTWSVPEGPRATWWLTRPLWVLGPLACTVPLLVASRLASRRRPVEPVGT